MAFIPEDGTGVVGANSLVTVQYADGYYADRGNDEWLNLTSDQKQSSLILATQFVLSQYQFRGDLLAVDQQVPFPRKNLNAPDGTQFLGIPSCVEQVVCELALRASRGALIPDPIFDENGRQVKMTSMAAGPLKMMTEYAGPGQLVDEPRFPSVDALIWAWLLLPTDKAMMHGVRAVRPIVNGVNNTTIFENYQDSNRYTGPYNENGRDVGLVGTGNSVR